LILVFLTTHFGQLLSRNISPQPWGVMWHVTYHCNWDDEDYNDDGPTCNFIDPIIQTPQKMWDIMITTHGASKPVGFLILLQGLILHWNFQLMQSIGVYEEWSKIDVRINDNTIRKYTHLSLMELQLFLPLSPCF